MSLSNTDKVNLGTSLMTGMLGIQGSRRARADQMELYRDQRNVGYDFAKNSIQWKTSDAKKAGLHPLAALGASTHSPGAISVQPTNTGKAMRSMGQDLSRAMSTALNTDQKKLSAAAVENAQLNNVLLREKIKQMSGPGSAPGHSNGSEVIPGQNDGRKVTMGSGSASPVGGHLSISRGSNAEQMEQEYGGVAGEIYGLFKLIKDLGRTLGKATPRPKKKNIRRELQGVRN